MVSFAHSSSKASCQYPAEASSFEKQTEPASFASTCGGIAGIMYLSRCTTLFSCLRSMQILTLSDFFGAATIGAHHGVGSVIVLITPSLPILPLSSLSTLGSNGIGTRRATFTWYGVAFSLMLIFTGEVFINHASPNTPGSILSSSMALGYLSNLRKPSAESSVRPSRLLP